MHAYLANWGGGGQARYPNGQRARRTSCSSGECSASEQRRTPNDQYRVSHMGYMGRFLHSLYNNDFFLVRLIVKIANITHLSLLMLILRTDFERNGEEDILQDPNGERHYDSFQAYALSKLGNILFTYALASRLRGYGITANCLESRRRQDQAASHRLWRLSRPAPGGGSQDICLSGLLPPRGERQRQVLRKMPASAVFAADLRP